MEMSGIPVPADLVLDAALPATTKLVWVAWQPLPDRSPIAVAQLQKSTGLSYPTVVKALAHLEAAGWGPGQPTRPLSPAPSLPTDPVTEPDVSARAKLLYGLLQLTPGFDQGSGQFTYAGLAQFAGASLNTVKDAVGNLVGTGWLQTLQKNQLAPVRFRLSNPHTDRAEAEVFMARLRLEDAEFRGEALMLEYLSLLIDSDNFQDHARPGFLKNPETGELMEFDRFYPPAVAFEFQGPQHFGATERISGQKAARQQARDLMKRGICQEQGINLITVTATDLRLDELRRRLGNLLPLRDLARHRPLVKYLEECSRRYRRASAKYSRSPRQK